jgi:DNA invertase Pin-like site-specific DNA recombinase
MNKEVKKTVRCAIYTRKSTEDGLEQDFNSLDAQREACEAYIKSQQHEGWTTIDKAYNDGGFSGGTLERPAIKELFKDISAREVDIVVIYKVDRLTRSLMDFSKIVELFDNNQASFVSITQSFNTTTSMGRLTLNMLLSFAQFEREVTGERIRDKVAASKKKGMWMGGCVPIGYEIADKKMLVQKHFASVIKIIYEKYLELKSVCKLKTYLDKSNISSRSGKDFSKGNLYNILSNNTYVGLVTHKENEYKGEHEAIIDIETFEKAQKLLLENRVDKNCGLKSSSNSLLAGKIFDDKNNRMSPSHSNTRKRKYRYYISLAVTKLKKGQEGSVSKIPAGEIEKFVAGEVKNFLQNTKKVQNLIKDYNVTNQNGILNAIKNITDFSNPRLVRAVLEKIVISKEWIEITLSQNQLIETLKNLANDLEPPVESKEPSENPIVIKRDIRISATSQTGCSTLIITTGSNIVPMPNQHLIKVIVKAHYWNELLLTGEAKTSQDIQRLEGLNDNSYLKQVLGLRFLAPEITEAILNGTQPRDLTMQKLFNLKTLDWQEQKKFLEMC